MSLRQISEADLIAFAKKVAKLRAEGLPTVTIAQRLGVPVTTMNERLRRHKERFGV